MSDYLTKQKRSDRHVALNQPLSRVAQLLLRAQTTQFHPSKQAMKLHKLFTIALTLIAALDQVNAAPVAISFDSPQASYVPTAPNVTQFVSNQFASLGIIFIDAETNGSPSVGDCTGGVGSDPFHLYGGTPLITGCGDTTPNINFVFVDPNNISNPGYTTDFSLLITDGSGTILTAFDITGNLLGSITTANGFNERIGISGVGKISRVNVRTPFDATAYDDLIFEAVQSFESHSVPEPHPIGLLALGLAMLLVTRRIVK